jgi:hypothetical protein
MKRTHFMLLPPQLRFNSHFGFDVVPGSEQETRILAKEVTLEGEAGKFLIFDGARLLHRGGLVDSGERVVLQLIFGSKRSIPRRALGEARRILGRFANGHQATT